MVSVGWLVDWAICIHWVVLLLGFPRQQPIQRLAVVMNSQMKETFRSLKMLGLPCWATAPVVLR